MYVKTGDKVFNDSRVRVKESVDKESLVGKSISYVYLNEEGDFEKIPGPSNTKYDGSSKITSIERGALVIDGNRMQPLAFDRVTEGKMEGLKFDVLVNMICPRFDDIDVV